MATQAELVILLQDIVGAKRVLQRPSELLVYTSDGLPSYRKQPMLAVPETREGVVEIVRTLAAVGDP